jgi:hypothetical protein
MKVTVRQFPATKSVRSGGPSIHAVDVTNLARVADALLADGRSDLASQVILVMYYCADRQANGDNIVSLRNSRSGGG